MHWCMLQKFKAYLCVQMIFVGERCPPRDITMDLLVKSVSKMIYDPQAAFDSAFFLTDGQNSTEKPNFTKSTSFSAKSWKSKHWKDYKKRSRLLKVVLSKANTMMENKLCFLQYINERGCHSEDQVLWKR